MKDIVPPPPPIVRNEYETIQALFRQYVVPSYGRFEVALVRGSGSEVWDVHSRRYLDLGGGIAVNCLGHAHPEITAALVQQSQRLIHVSNLYYHEPQGRLAEALVRLIAPGKVFFANSGGEANEGLFKLARGFGHDEGRFEILTARNSFHGRTLAGIAATGQERFRKGFEPTVTGFRHIPYNDLQAARECLSPATVAILIEGVQGEGGITPATAEYLLGLRRLCDEKKLLLLMDGVQCGYFRTGRFQSFQRILEGVAGGEEFVPDGISMAKSLGGGFPIGAFWVRDEVHGVKLSDILGPGMHATTYGGTPLACAVALRVLEVVQRDRLADNARNLGAWLKSELERLVREFPGVLVGVRGLGMMIGFELAPKEQVPALAAGEKTAAAQFVDRLHAAGLLTIPAGPQVIRLLPALNLTPQQAAEGIAAIAKVASSLA